MEIIKSRYYTVKDIKALEGCGKDAAYELANKLPHENVFDKLKVDQNFN